MSSICGGGVKKAYEEKGKQSICGKKRVVYKRVKGKPTTKVYMKHKGKFCQVKNFIASMVVAGKWKSSSTKTKSPKACKQGKVRNPKTGRCVKSVSPKKCKAGKVRNPKTGRCVKSK